MARIARIVTYVVDPYEHSTNTSIEDTIRNMITMNHYKYGLLIASIKSEEKDFEWNDNSILDNANVTELDVAKFYREL